MKYFIHGKKINFIDNIIIEIWLMLVLEMFKTLSVNVYCISDKEF